MADTVLSMEFGSAAVPQIVMDTNVYIAALRSRRGASYLLLSLPVRRVFAPTRLAKFPYSVYLYCRYKRRTVCARVFSVGEIV
jgi:hypothetical protein